MAPTINGFRPCAKVGSVYRVKLSHITATRSAPATAKEIQRHRNSFDWSPAWWNGVERRVAHGYARQACGYFARRKMISKNTLSIAICATVISLCALGRHQAMAGFGEPTQAADIGLAKSIRNNLQPGQLHEMMEVFGAHSAQMVSIVEPLRAIRGQISDQLAGSGPVDATQLEVLAEQAFPRRAQADMLDLTQQIELRLITTPAQIAEAYDLNQHTVALNARFNGVLSLPRYTTSVYLPSDFFGDNLGYTRGLNLTDDQYSQMNNIRAGNAAALEAIQQQRHAVRQQIAAQMGGSGTVTVAALAPLQQQESALKDQLDMLRLNMTIKIRALLTPEQLARAADLHQQLATLHAQETAAERAAMDQARSTN